MTLSCSVPYVYTLEITSDCNANCIGCGNVFSHCEAHLASSNLQTILMRIAPYAEMVRITGGEPTISPEFATIMALVDRLEKPIVVFTNGLWPDADAVIRTLQACRNLDGILASLHGHSASSCQAFTQKDNFSTVLANIRRASQSGIVVNTNTILTRPNIDHMDEIVDLAMGAGAQVVAFSRYYGAPIPNLTDLTAYQFKQALDQVAEFRAAGKQVKFNNNIPFCFAGQLTQACPAGDTHCTISPTCKVRVCNHSPYEVGDILKVPIEEIWKSSELQQWRQQTPDICGQCAAFDLCHAGCRANAQTNGLPADPLACGPLHTVPIMPPVQHLLYQDARPIAHFSLHKEHFGYILINRSQIFKVTDKAEPLIDVLMHGRMTTSEIARQFGQDALNFVGLLYDRRMIELAHQ